MVVASDGALDNGYIDDIVMVRSAVEFADSGAWTALIGSVSQPAIMRARLYWRGPPLQASARTGAGTRGTTSSAMKPMCKAHIRLSFRSPAMRAPMS